MLDPNEDGHIYWPDYKKTLKTFDDFHVRMALLWPLWLWVIIGMFFVWLFSLMSDRIDKSARRYAAEECMKYD